jgi:hypothetical protein
MNPVGIIAPCGERLAPDSEEAMRKPRFTEEQLVAILRPADREPVSAAPAPARELLRKGLKVAASPSFGLHSFQLPASHL